MSLVRRLKVLETSAMHRTRIGINGFGRMGRLALRAGWGVPGIELVHINELKGGASTAAHLLTFDSVHGRWAHDVAAQGEDAISIDGKQVTFSAHVALGDVPWDAHGVDIVLECSGKFRTPETLAPYYARGVKKVIVAAPVKERALNVVMGVNDHLYEHAKHHLLTAASCTTNCLAPVVKVIHEGLGIRHGAITTIHDITNTQSVVDAPHKDLRRARANSLSLIPTTTGSATAIALIYPELKGKLNGLAVRVPLLNASLTDCVFEVARATTVEEVNAMLKAAADGPLKGILGYEERPLVSVDYKDDTRSSIIDALSTMVIDGTSVKILAWYDNEIGYVNRMVELACKVASALPSPSPSRLPSVVPAAST
jgi:glyceraldehyde 3-phosphate dehydrogenase